MMACWRGEKLAGLCMLAASDKFIKWHCVRFLIKKFPNQILSIPDLDS